MRHVLSSWKTLSLFLTFASTLAFSNIIYLDIDGRVPNDTLQSIEDCIHTNEIYLHNFGELSNWNNVFRIDQSLICGNFCLPDLQKKTKRKKPILILSVRDPIERALSVAEETVKPNGEKGINPLRLTANPICKMLASNPKLEGTEMFLDCIENCKKMDLVLLPDEKEKYQVALTKLRKKLSLGDSSSFSKVSSKLLKSETPSSVIQNLKEMHQFDIALYQYLKKHSDSYSFNKEMVPSKAYKRLQKPKKNIHYTFDKPLIGQGFSERKFNNHGKFYYRHVEEKAEMFFALIPGNYYRLQFRAKTKKLHDFPFVTIDGKKISPRKIEKENYCLYQLYFKKHRKRKATTNIAFQIKNGMLIKEIDITSI